MIWILGGMIKLGGNQKHLAELAPWFPFLRNYWAKLATLEIKGRRTKKYDDIKSFQVVKITRYDSSKQEREPSKLTIRDSNFWENENSMKKRELHVEKGNPWRKGTYISQVSIHAYWSWYITFILDISVSHHHLLIERAVKPSTFK